MLILATDPEDTELLYFIVTATGVSNEVMARSIRNIVGVGNPFLAFHNGSVPNSVRLNPAWDPSTAPIVSGDETENLTLINGMLADQLLQAVPNQSVWAA